MQPQPSRRLSVFQEIKSAAVIYEYGAAYVPPERENDTRTRVGAFNFSNLFGNLTQTSRN